VSAPKIIIWKDRLETVNISRFTVAILLLMTFIGTVTELIGLSLFIPIFQYLRLDGSIDHLTNESHLWKYAIEGFQYFGLQISLASLLILSFFMFSIKQVLGFVKILYEKSINLKTIKIMRDSLFSKYLYANMDYQEKNTTGDFINNIVVETDRAARGVMMPIGILGHTIILLGYIVVLFLLSWEMTIIAIVISIITVITVSGWVSQSRVVGRGITKSNTELTNFLTPRLRSLRIIRLSGTESLEIKKFKILTKQQYDYFYKSTVLVAKNKSIIEPIVISLSLLYIYLSYTFFSMSIEMIGLYLIVIFRLMPLLKATIGLYQGMASVEGSIESVLNKYCNLDKFKEVDKGKYKIKNIVNKIDIENVFFKYKKHGENILSFINISISSGKMLAIVGHSGSGKSTLMDLIPRLRNTTSGVVKFNDVSIDSYTLESLRSVISYLPQSPQIFSGTIKDHISYGGENVTMDEVYNAAALSGADEFIRNLENGYDEIITDDALNLSGGQKQRLDLARAIIKRSKVLLLDEPSSSLDAASEEKFRLALKRIRSKTDTIIVMITHRLQNAYIADNIVVLNNGKIEDNGTHSELIKTNKWYRNAWDGGSVI
jgi:ABC-type multidrug transport system fused ATPase/permease subunit